MTFKMDTRFVAIIIINIVESSHFPLKRNISGLNNYGIQPSDGQDFNLTQRANLAWEAQIS